MPLIIDGHNLIGKMKSISLSDPEDEAKLVASLARNLQFSERKAIVIFDSGAGGGHTPPPRGPKIQVKFAPVGGSADSIIMDMIRRDPNPKGLTIVSSDNEIRQCARARRAKLVSAEDFAEQLESGPERPTRRRGKDDSPADIDVKEWLEYFEQGRK
jgi:hypothetical protein